AGAILGSFRVAPEGRLSGNLVASGLPLSSIDMLGSYARPWDGTVSGVARLAGRLDALEVTADVDVSPLRSGRIQLPGSHLQLRFEPAAHAFQVASRSHCGHTIAPPFDVARYGRDESRGVVHVTGQLWGGQAVLDDFRVTQQRSKTAMGKILLRDLDVGSLLATLPGWTDERKRVEGKLSGQVR